MCTLNISRQRNLGGVKSGVFVEAKYDIFERREQVISDTPSVQPQRNYVDIAMISLAVARSLKMIRCGFSSILVAR